MSWIGKLLQKHAVNGGLKLIEQLQILDEQELVQQNHSCPEHCMKIVILQCLRLNYALLKSQNLGVK